MPYDKNFMKKYRTMDCIIDGNNNGEVFGEHIKTKASGGECHPDNVMPLKLKYHHEKGWKGVRYMADKYPAYKQWLLDHNWRFDSFLGKYMHLGPEGWEDEE